MTEDKYAAKVAALLAKAEATESDEEAAALMAKAADLMAKYQIDEAMIGMATGVPQGAPEQRRFWFGGTYGLDQATGTYWCIEATYGDTVKAVYLSGVYDRWGLTQPRDTRKGYVLVAYAWSTDLDGIDLMTASLLLQSTAAQKRYSKRMRDSWEWTYELSSAGKQQARKSYVLGWYRGVSEAITAAKPKRKAEAAASTGGKAEVALRDRADAVAEFFDQQVGKTRSARSRNVNGEAYRSGRADGRNADIGRTRVGAARAIGR